MKKIYRISAALALLVATVSCEKGVVETDFTSDEIPMVPVTLTGSIPETRVSLDGVTPKWTAGDQITVFTTDGVRCPAFSATQGGSATTTFTGTKPDGSTLGFALYPYSASASYSNGTCTFSLPAEQDGTLGSAVMAAVVPAGEEEMIFSNLCTLVKVHIPAGMTVTKVELLRSDRVSGSFTVNGSTLAVTPAASPSGDDLHVVASKSAGWTNTDVYLSVLPSSSKQLELLLTNAAGKMALVSKTLKTDFSAGHLKTATVPSNLVFSDVAKIGSSTASQQYTAATQIDRSSIVNGNFESWTQNGIYLPDSWNSFQTATGNYAGTGYSSSNRQVERSTDKRPGSTGKYSCSIWSRKITVLFISVVAQGNLTTGRIHAGSMSASGANNYNFSDRSNGYAMRFTGRPDSLVYWVKFVPLDNANNDKYEARVVAYLHGDSDFQDRANGTEDVSIGKVENTFRTTNNAWVRHALKFNYTSTASPSYILINVSTNKTPGGGATGDYLYIDDMEVIYPDTYNVKTGSNGWATLYLDFAALVPSGATAYYVTEVIGGYARLVSIPSGSVIPKNTPVLVKGAASTQYTFDGSKNTPVTVSGNLLRGTLTDISRPSGTCRVLSAESTSSMAAFGAYSGSTIKANTAWLAQ